MQQLSNMTRLITLVFTAILTLTEIASPNTLSNII